MNKEAIVLEIIGFLCATLTVYFVSYITSFLFNLPFMVSVIFILVSIFICISCKNTGGNDND